MSVALAFASGLLLGSVPIAWVLVRLCTKSDVSTAGSGNVGALNASRVAKSKWIGVVVMLLDIAKGAVAAWLPTNLLGLTGDAAWLSVAGAMGAMAGHNFNPWLSLARRRWVGGKGFAAAAGGAFVFEPWFVAIWLGVGVAMWFLLYKAKRIKDEAPASAVATLALIPTGALLVGAPGAGFGIGMTLLVFPRLGPEVRAVWRAAPPPSSLDEDG